MGVNYYVYLKDTAGFSVGAFADYCKRFGLQIKMPENLDLRNASGVLSMQLTGEHLGELSAELGLSMQECPKVSPRNDAPVELTDFEQAVRSSRFVLALRCSDVPSEALAAHLLGAYLAQMPEGVFVNHRTGAYYTAAAPMEEIIRQMIG